MSDNPEALLLKSKQRSSAYPSYTILDCIEFTKNIYTQYGNSYQTRDTIIKVLHFNADTLNKSLSSCVQYELLDLKAKEGYKPTTRFISIYKPLSEDERKQALLDCLKSPKIYAALLEQYNNNIVPDVPVLSTDLYRNHSISGKAAERAAQVFLDNIKNLGLVDADNHLSLQPGDVKLVVGTREKENKEKNDLINAAVKEGFYGQWSFPVTTNISTGKERLPLVISLKGKNRKAEIIYPIDMANEDWERVIRKIQAMKDV